MRIVAEATDWLLLWRCPTTAEAPSSRQITMCAVPACVSCSCAIIPPREVQHSCGDRLGVVVQVPSDQNISFDENPEMKCHKITDLAVKALQSGKYRHMGCNYRHKMPNVKTAKPELKGALCRCPATRTSLLTRSRR